MTEKLRAVAPLIAMLVGLAAMGLLIFPWDIQTKAMAKDQHDEIKAKMSRKIESAKSEHEQIRSEINRKLDKLEQRTWEILQAVKK